MMKSLLLAAALGMLAGSAQAQNTKGTRAEARITTTTNPGGSVGLPTPSDGRSHATEPSGTNRLKLESNEIGTRSVRERGQEWCVSQVVPVNRQTIRGMEMIGKSNCSAQRQRPTTLELRRWSASSSR